MACNLPKLIRDLKKIAVDGMVEGIPLDVAVIRLTGAYTAQMNSKFDSDKSIQGKLKKIKELIPEKEKVEGRKELGKNEPSSKGPKEEFDKLPTHNPNTRSMTYAGIGSRQTPSNVLKKMTEIATYLEKQGYTLNTGVTFGGKEEGADKAFSDGAKKKNLFSPEEQGTREKEQTIAKEVHPAPGNLKGGGLKLMARNTNQVFGDNLDTPVDFVLFYAKETSGIRPEGGTGQAVEMARLKGIPTINMAVEGWEDRLRDVLSTKTKEIKEQVSQNDTFKVTNGNVTFKNGTTKTTVTSLNELVSLSEDLNEVIRSEGRSKDYDLTHINQMFTLLSKAGIKFNPVVVDISKTSILDKEAKGWYTTARGKSDPRLQLLADKTFDKVSPMQVMLHEYVHHITMENLEKNKELQTEVKALMQHVLKHKPGLGKEYAFKDEKEFLAEVIAEPRLKVILETVPPMKEKQNVWNALKNAFKELLDSLKVKDVKEINAYTEALELVLRTAGVKSAVETEVKEVEPAIEVKEQMPWEGKKRFPTKGKAQLDPAIIEQAENCK